ncbi:MAG: hypothetical protein ACLPID_08570 [Beijerinckiaceae bacterium]
MENKAGLGEHHLLLFGTIIQRFAAHELLMQRIMAHVLGTQPASVMLLTRHLPFEGKRKALLDLLRHRNVPRDQCDRVSTYLNVPLAQARLRNDIVHSVWTKAQEADFIQPAWIIEPLARVKPVHARPDVSSAEFIEDEDEKFAYSLDDLTEIAAALENNRANFAAYLAEVGLVDKF